MLCVGCECSPHQLLSHTAVAELCQEELVTEEELQRTIGGEGYLSDRVIPIQCTKPSEVASRAIDILHKCGTLRQQGS